MTLTTIAFTGQNYSMRKIPEDQHTIFFMQKKQLASSTTYIQMLPSFKYQIHENLVKRNNSYKNMTQKRKNNIKDKMHINH